MINATRSGGGRQPTQPIADIGQLLTSASILQRALDGMAVAAQYGGDSRALTIILNMRAALDAGDISVLQRWMGVLERHASRSKNR